MKVLKSNLVKLILYIIGYVSVIFAIMGLASLFVRTTELDQGETFDTVYEESYTIKNDVKSDIECTQFNARADKTLRSIDLNNALLEIYDYSDIAYSSSDIKAEKVNTAELLDEGDKVEELREYLNCEGESNTIHATYPSIKDEPEDTRLIRIRWADYQSLVRKECDRYDETTDLSEAENIITPDGMNYAESVGLYYGDYYKIINDKLYYYQQYNEFIFYAPLGCMSIPYDIQGQDYVYFPYSEDVNADNINDYILSSKMYRSDVELFYAYLKKDSKDLLEENTSWSSAYTSGSNTAYSLDGKELSQCYIYNTEGLESVRYNSDDKYNYTYKELVDLYRNNSDIFVSYDAETGKLEQWYKDKSGNQVPYEYLSKADMRSITGICNEDFVLGINESSQASHHLQKKMVYDLCRTFNYPIWLVIMAAAIFMACVVLLIITEPVKMYAVDKAPYVVWSIVYMIVFSIGYLIAGSIVAEPSVMKATGYEKNTAFLLISIGLLIIYLITAAFVMNVVRRIKCAKFLEGFLVFRFIRYLYRKIKNATKDIEGKNKLIALSVVVILANAIGLILVSFNGYGVIVMLFKALVIAVVMIIDIVAVLLILKYMSDIQTVLKTSRKIEAGELDAKVDTSKLHFNAAEIGDSLNNLGTGLSTAVENSIRDERTKAELITNVSHDIKTPLTSIINYVDLLKKEDIDNENAKEYINVLDQKSQRLKQLIIDLIEASKTSTGNIELENINLNLAELINQGLGEYEDRFQQAELELIRNISSENAVIHADGRRVFRIIDNLLNNAVKYAKSGTRVYVDLAERDGRVNFSIKNLSNDMLNISADELMERFVRGDRSRNTEGSGLGLSIAKNLTELQNGTFDITIDGDLFKVEISFPCVDSLVNIDENKDENH